MISLFTQLCWNVTFVDNEGLLCVVTGPPYIMKTPLPNGHAIVIISITIPVM